MQLENILLDGNRILLGDWGSAQTYMTGIPSAAFESMQGYDAPEVLARKSHFLPHTDCWSLGVTLYTLACGKLPFDRTSPSYAQSVMSGSYPMPAHISTRLRSLICGLLSVDHVTRLTIFGVAKLFRVRSLYPNRYPAPRVLHQCQAATDVSAHARRRPAAP